MLIFFEYINFHLIPNEKTIFGSNPILNFEKNSTNSFFLSFLKVFQDKILINQSKYVQFLIFYLTSFNENYREFSEKFLSILICNICQENIAKLIKINSVCYLSSFITRAKFLKDEIIEQTLEYLLNFLKDYIKNEFINESQEILSRKDISLWFTKHENFYLIIQSIMYIFCFKGRNFMKKNNGFIENFYKSFGILIKKNVKFFGFLSKDVVNEFTGIFKEFLKFFEEEIIPNWQINYTVENHFPFDPYLLKNSREYLNRNYNFWIENKEKMIKNERKNEEICEDLSEQNNNFNCKILNEKKEDNKKKVGIIREEKNLISFVVEKTLNDIKKNNLKTFRENSLEKFEKSSKFVNDKAGESISNDDTDASPNQYDVDNSKKKKKIKKKSFEKKLKKKLKIVKKTLCRKKWKK